MENQTRPLNFALLSVDEIQRLMKHHQLFEAQLIDANNKLMEKLQGKVSAEVEATLVEWSRYVANCEAASVRFVQQLVDASGASQTRQ